MHKHINMITDVQETFECKNLNYFNLREAQTVDLHYILEIDLNEIIIPPYRNHAFWLCMQ